MSENPNEGRLGEWRDDLRQFRKFGRFHRHRMTWRYCKKRLQKVTRRTRIRNQLIS
jgi:hypothetical protein